MKKYLKVSIIKHVVICLTLIICGSTYSCVHGEVIDRSFVSADSAAVSVSETVETEPVKTEPVKTEPVKTGTGMDEPEQLTSVPQELTGEIKEEVTESQTESTGENKEKININTADKTELMKLNGIGEAKASKIIEYRDTHGAFKEISDIMNVSGIKEKAFEKIKDMIMV